jgi:hypothetical protein
MSSFRGHEVRKGSSAASSEKLKAKEWEVMGLDTLIDAQLYMRSR